MPEKQVWTWVIGGQQGEGIDSVGEIFAGALHRAGWWVYASRHFMSRIKGGHTHYTISFGAEPVNHVEDEVDVVLALDREAVEAIAGRCRPDTVVLYDRG
ncbi:MAG: 2-oxoacid:acceptor oxidoreductase family protein, partial [Clostridia bacterium]|nr:2-oxoacid:acceptor oxidoreductase family protein [Clostridia bacterium]